MLTCSATAQQRVIAVISGKGAAARAHRAGARGHRVRATPRWVVLVDLAPVGGATLGVGLDPGATGRRATADVFGGAPARDVLGDVADGFAVLATPALVYNEAQAERGLSQLLAQLADYEIVVIDTPPGFGAFVRAAAAAATEILVPIRAEPMATWTAEYVLGFSTGSAWIATASSAFCPRSTRRAGCSRATTWTNSRDSTCPCYRAIPNGVRAALGGRRGLRRPGATSQAIVLLRN